MAWSITKRNNDLSMTNHTFLDIEDTYCLRGIAMLMIIIGHANNGYPLDDPACYFPSWLSLLHIEYWGGMGVGVFLFLSGYGLFLTLSRRDRSLDWRYIFAKFKRLFEPFLVYWVVELAVLAIFNRSELTTHVLNEIVTFSIHPDVENWFFKVIVVIYIVTIALFKFKMSNTLRLVALSTLSLLYLIVMRELGYGLWWFDTILCFPVGAFVAARYQWFASRPALLMCAAGAVVISVLFLVHMNTIVFNLAFVWFSIYAICVVNIQSRVLHFIGFNSFIFYFLECPVMDEVVKFSYPHFPLYFLLSVVVTFALSFICVKAVRMFKTFKIS